MRLTADEVIELLGMRPLAGEGGVWQGSALAPGGFRALVGTTMSPGFHIDDLELGDRAALQGAFPGEVELIERLTRVSP